MTMRPEQMAKLKEMVNEGGEAIYWTDDFPRQIKEIKTVNFKEVGYLEDGGYVDLSLSFVEEFRSMVQINLK
jgi:hypothetical protein